MSFKEKFQKILQKLSLTDKAKANNLSSAEWDSLVVAYKEAYGTNLKDDLKEEKSAATISEEDAAAALALLSSITGEQNEGATATATASAVAEGETQGAPAAPAPAATAPATDVNVGAQLVEAAQKVVNAFNTVTSRAAADVPSATATGAGTVVGLTGMADRSKYLFGIENAMFDMSKRWNKITANPAFAITLGDATQEEAKAFVGEVRSFASGLKSRYDYLHANNLLGDPNKLASGEFTSNYDGVADAKVGNQYIIRRQDALIARILMKRDITQYFSVRYGIQDRDVMFSAFFSEVSQAYQPGQIYKGSMAIEPEIGHVDDAMIKMEFGPMKDLERIYLGYLNKEGSDPIKWSIIEFAVLNSLENAQVEQNKRRVRGIYVKPETGLAGLAINSSTGLIYTLLRYVHENKLKLHDSSEYRTYTSADMLETVQAFCSDVLASVSEDEELDDHVVYLNKKHQQWWIANVRAVYGKDTDFQGPDSYLNRVPDQKFRIVWLPYLGNLTMMFMQAPGNIQMLEYVPGEMLAMKMEEQMEMVRGWSTWKEGCAASFIGRRFATKAALDANNYVMQQIFMNKFSVDLAADATTADATKGFWFVTAANTAAKAITDITGAKAGVAYIIECGNTTNATTIAQADKFSTITEAYTPTAIGDYIMVILNSAGKFLELERQVGGVRTVNILTQPNLPGGR
jgi:hypothetical protein